MSCWRALTKNPRRLSAYPHERPSPIFDYSGEAVIVDGVERLLKFGDFRCALMFKQKELILISS